MTPAKARQHAQARDHRAAVEAAIFEATEAFLADHPLRELTVEGVIAPTGLGRTAFYRYFPDLETVLLRRLAQIDTELNDATDRWLDPDHDPETGLVAAALALATVYHRHAALLRAFAEAAAAGADLEAAWLELVASFVAQASERIDALIDRGQVRLEHPAEVARALVGMTERYLLDSLGCEPVVSVEVAASTLAQIWQRTLFSPAGRGPAVAPLGSRQPFRVVEAARVDLGEATAVSDTIQPDPPWWHEAVVYQIYPRSFADSERRRGRRPRRHPRPSRPPELAGGRRHLAVPVLPVAHEGLRLRRQRLLRRRPALRHPGRLRRPGRRGPRRRPAGARRLGAQPHLDRAPVVRRVAVVARQPQARLVHLARPGARRRTAQQLDQRLRRSHRLGSSTRPPASTTCTCSCPSRPTSTGATRRWSRPWPTPCGSGSTGASTASAWTWSSPWSSGPTSADLDDPNEILFGDAHLDPPATHALLRDIRRLLDGYPGDRVAVGETSVLSTAKMAAYYGHDDELHLCFNFPQILAPWDAASVAPTHRAAPTRCSTRSGPGRPGCCRTTTSPATAPATGDPRPRPAAAVVVMALTLRGTPFLYEGEELGLLDAVVPPERRLDPIDRDGCRAPVPWTRAAPHGWGAPSRGCPCPPEPDVRSVEAERDDPVSVLHLYRRLLALRHAIAGPAPRLDRPAGRRARRRRDRLGPPARRRASAGAGVVRHRTPRRGRTGRSRRVGAGGSSWPATGWVRARCSRGVWPRPRPWSWLPTRPLSRL